MEDFSNSTILLLLILLLSIPLFLLRISLTKKPNLPPSPFKLPIIGNLHLLGPFPHKSFYELSKKYGPIIHLQLGQVPTLVVLSPEFAREVLKGQDKIFASRPSLKASEILFYGCRDIGFSPYGEQWRKVRKIGTLHLFNSKKVLSFRGMREETVAHMIENIRIASASSSGLVNLSKVFKSYVVESIATVTFGEGFLGEGMSERIQRLVEENGKLLFELHLEDLFPSYKWLEFFTGLNARATKIFHGWDDLFNELIDAHIRAVGGADEGNSDFVDVLLALQKEDSRDGAVLTRNDIKAILQDIFGAGIETSHVLLEWSMAELIRNPNVLTKLKEEIEETIKGKSTVAEDDISQMEYLRAIFKETLRLHPPAPLLIPRESTEDTTIQNYMIPARTRVFVNAWAIQRDTEYWESPEEFLPERFLRNSLDFNGNDFKFFPFGGGRRICPGVHIGLSNFELVLANLIHHFEWKLPNGMKERDLDMDEAPGIVVKMKSPLLLVATDSQ
ncbi:Premnaspirodiene oxygenase [Acorus calamus]|uniref:Premnaspirodiene oxygenase n=1 Tax=Acorus calamus TaxID=4465 RepID=A0AAV9CZ63_ACOCL|nr:Premnaspirodiene oxygenase [Acorus calamus]